MGLGISCVKYVPIPANNPHVTRPKIVDQIIKKIDSESFTEDDLKIEGEDTLDVFEYLEKLEINAE